MCDHCTLYDFTPNWDRFFIVSVKQVNLKFSDSDLLGDICRLWCLVRSSKISFELKNTKIDSFHSGFKIVLVFLKIEHCESFLDFWNKSRNPSNQIPKNILFYPLWNQFLSIVRAQDMNQINSIFCLLHTLPFFARPAPFSLCLASNIFFYF